MPSLAEFAKLLSLHDWFYAFSDDHRVWLAGKNREKEIENLSLSSPDHLALYNLWRDFIRELVSSPAERSEEVRSSFLVKKAQFFHALPDEKRPTSPL